MRLTDEQIRLILRSGKKGAVRMLRLVDENALADGIGRGAIKLSGKELATVLFSAAAKAKDDLAKATAVHRKALDGLPSSSPIVAPLPAVTGAARTLGVFH